MKKTKIRVICLTITAGLLLANFAGCKGNSAASADGVSAKDQFGWWIAATDSYGTYYEKYEENPAVQWINHQYWDTENKTLGTEENGTKIALSFQAPITGAESDNFNTMIATGEYPEIIDMSYAESPQALYENGILMDITEYVEEYCPNYIALLDENPELKKFVTTTDENGDVHYYHLASLSDGTGIPWEGYMYRRDWIVKYAEPTAYVWDWDSDYVTENGHPKYTPLAAAEEAGDYTGWKENEVTEFTSEEGTDPDNDYTDNVIFPSGKSDPYTVSDWEWMMEAFAKALKDRGYEGDANAYCLSMYYMGFLTTGDLVSSFGGGNGGFYVDQNQNVSFDGTSDNFKLYLECMNNWYQNGWIDKSFETRSSDSFWQINETGYSQGMVGMWCGGIGVLGDTIRATCANAEDAKDAMVFGCSLPVNDEYGTEEQKFVKPDCLYQGSEFGLGIGITTKCEEKDLAALFSFFNWTYSLDGALVGGAGLSEEQYTSMEFDPDVYGDNNLTGAYTEQKSADGILEITKTVDSSSSLSEAVKSQRLSVGLSISGNEERGYVIDFGYTANTQRAIKLWTAYESTGDVRDYQNLLSEDESAAYSKINTYLNDYMGQAVPEMIKNGLGTWEEYCTKVQKYNPDSVAEIFRKYVD